MARQAVFLTDGGAYNDQGLAVSVSAGSKLSSLYRVPHVKIDGKVVFTNKVWGGAFRRLWKPSDHLCHRNRRSTRSAEELGIDPLEIRLLNANQPGDVTVSGTKLTSCWFFR